MRSTQFLQSLIVIVLVISFVVGCGNTASTPEPKTPEATSPPEQGIATPTTEPPTATPTPRTIDIQALSTAFDSIFQNAAKDQLFGGSVLVAQNGQVIFRQAYGLADRDKQIHNTVETKFRIASITKQFTAMAIMMLQEQGKLNVQDKICTYLTDCPEIWKPITVHHLLTHTSGIPDNTDLFYLKDPSSPVPLENMIADAKSLPLDFQPGEKFGYSGTGYILLGKIIEAVSGQSYEAFLQKTILDPLQMSNTGFDHNRNDLPVGYQGQTHVSWQMNAWVESSAGGLYSTVDDLYRWDQALYTNKLVSQITLDAIFTPYIITGTDGWGYGYGWRIGPQDQRRFITYGGITDGFTRVIKRYPDDQATIIILSNQDKTDGYGLADQVASKLFGK